MRETNVGFNLVPAMLSGKVDATLGGFWNYEGIQLALQDRAPTMIRVDQAGVPTYDELVVVAREDYVRERRQPRSAASCARAGAGYESARADPAGAVDALVAANPDLDAKLQLASVRATLPAFFPADTREGRSATRTRASGRGLRRLDAAQPAGQAPAEAGDALTNEFLPGPGRLARRGGHRRRPR